MLRLPSTQFRLTVFAVLRWSVWTPYSLHSRSLPFGEPLSFRLLKRSWLILEKCDSKTVALGTAPFRQTSFFSLSFRSFRHRGNQVIRERALRVFVPCLPCQAFFFFKFSFRVSRSKGAVFLELSSLPHLEQRCLPRILHADDSGRSSCRLSSLFFSFVERSIGDDLPESLDRLGGCFGQRVKVPSQRRCASRSLDIPGFSTFFCSVF